MVTALGAAMVYAVFTFSTSLFPGGSIASGFVVPGLP